MKNEKITEKLNAYGKDMRYLKTYINFFVWVMVVLFVYGAVDMTIHSDGCSIWEIVRMQILAVLSVFSAFTVRDLDKSGLYSNIILLILWPVSYAVILFFSIRATSTAMGEAVSGLSGLGFLGAVFAGSIAAGTQIGIMAALVRLLIIAAVCGGFAWALWKDRELFEKTTKQLQEQF